MKPVIIRPARISDDLTGKFCAPEMTGCVIYSHFNNHASGKM
jgi:hypothetical protein